MTTVVWIILLGVLLSVAVYLDPALLKALTDSAQPKVETPAVIALDADEDWLYFRLVNGVYN